MSAAIRLLISTTTPKHKPHGLISGTMSPGKCWGGGGGRFISKISLCEILMIFSPFHLDFIFTLGALRWGLDTQDHQT